MKYSEFEMLVLGIGGTAILATTLLSLGQGFDAYELGAQLLILGVLFGAVHWGRRGGIVAATAATFAYLALRLPLILQIGLTADIVAMLVARIAAFGLIGIVGGEVCARVMYFLARLRDESAIDPWSGVFNQRIAARLLTSAAGQCQRYGQPFCIVTVALPASLTSELRESKARAVVRGVADYIRDDVRMVDEVARLDDGRFLVLLPHTPKDGGTIVEQRLNEGVRQVAGAREGVVETVCLAGVEDAEAIDALLAEITPADAAPRLAGGLS